MIIHSIVPHDLVFPHTADILRTTTLQCGGVTVEATPLGDGQYCILRLLNGTCTDYLQPRLQPGQIWRR